MSLPLCRDAVSLFYKTQPTGLTTPGFSRPESDGNERVLHSLLTPEVESQHQIQFSVILRTPYFSEGVSVILALQRNIHIKAAFRILKHEKKVLSSFEIGLKFGKKIILHKQKEIPITDHCRMVDHLKQIR